MKIFDLRLFDASHKIPTHWLTWRCHILKLFGGIQINSFLLLLLCHSISVSPFLLKMVWLNHRIKIYINSSFFIENKTETCNHNRRRGFKRLNTTYQPVCCIFSSLSQTNQKKKCNFSLNPNGKSLLPSNV